jgi:hypothetical protein
MRPLTDFVLKGIPEDLWRQVKHLAIDEGLNLRTLLLKMIAVYLEAVKEEGKP